MKDPNLLKVCMYPDELEDYIRYLVFDNFSIKTELHPEGIISKKEAWLFFRMYQRYIDDDFFVDVNAGIYQVVYTDILDNCMSVSPETIGKGLFSELEKAYYIEHETELYEIAVEPSEDLQKKLRNKLKFNCDFTIESYSKEWKLMLLRKN